MTYTGMQVAGCAMMCLAAGIGIGSIGLRLIEAIAERRHGVASDAALDEELTMSKFGCTFGRYA